MSLTIAENDVVTLGANRHKVCLEAAYEIEALAKALRAVVPIEDSDGEHLAVRGISMRIKELAGVVMSGLHDEIATTEDLEHKVMGLP